VGVQVSFYSDAAEPLNYACRLIRRALASGKPVGVCVPPGLAARFDALLWSFDAAEFIPHRRWDGTTPSAPGEVLLVDDAARLPHRALLLNLCDEMPRPRARSGWACALSRLSAGRCQAGPLFSGRLTTLRPCFPE
jgi:DNA polymerase-3 subunit chi